MTEPRVGDDLSTLDIVDHHRFGSGYPHDEWARLRSESPVCPMRIPGWEPFWAVTTSEHIRTVSSRPSLFRNAPALHVQPLGAEPDGSFRSIINMDPPEHGRYRRLVTTRLTRRWVASWRPRLEDVVHDLLDRTWTTPPVAECEFVSEVAEWFPFHVIAELLGIPESDHHLVLDLMNRNLLGGLPDFMDYMRELALERRRRPGDDLGSILSTAEIDGELLGETELVSYYCSLATAAHGTVRNAISGAMSAFVAFPDQFERLRSEPAMLDSAVEEVLRWTTPIVSFARTASADTELGGCELGAGDRLLLVYGSANRDEDVHEAPFEFRLDRDPNPHLAFGIGEHYCLGARLARLELAVFLEAVAARVSGLELTGPVERYQSSLLSGVERLPLRFDLASRA